MSDHSKIPPHIRARQVLINRLRLLSHADIGGVRSACGLKNTGIFAGEWLDGRQAVFRSWPIFANFDRNIVPAFLIRLSQQDYLPVRMIVDDPAFALCGGECLQTQLHVDAGTPQVPDAEVIELQFTVEKMARARGVNFLATVRRMS